MRAVPPVAGVLVLPAATAWFVGSSLGGEVPVCFDAVLDQLPLDSTAEVQSPDDVDFETRMDRFGASVDGPFEYGRVVSHDARLAVVNFVRHHEVALLVLGRALFADQPWLDERDLNWISRHCCSADLVVVESDEAWRARLLGRREPQRIVGAFGGASIAGS
ncbi:hypothetical protein [Salinibacter grassmerensis]|uniref:hypothetical protein n=1 Tax=Salinibacter grassmerensis TaxID=3040353 RepID=UPI0021E7B5E6|nr:hypothetical protein [Salinibacter grassmerensis]